MINLTLYRQEMKNSVRTLLVFMAVIAMYVAVIIGMYDAKMMTMLDQFYRLMPGLLSAVGMKAGSTTLIGFMISSLYGFIFIVFPMIFCILRANGLIAKYADRGSLVMLLAAPVKRRAVVLTQLSVLITGIALLIGCITGLEFLAARLRFPGQLAFAPLLRLNAALFCLHLFLGSICFLFSCVFSEIKYSIAFGAGIPVLMYALHMLANAGAQTGLLRYFTCFTLFDASGIVAGSRGAALGSLALFLGSVSLFGAGAVVFCQKDWHI